MTDDIPPPYSEKPKGQPGGQGYSVAINHGSLLTSKKSLPSDEGKASCEAKGVKIFGTEPEGFQFIQPARLRSLENFFTLPVDGIPNCDRLSSNFTYNLWYFQKNYAVLWLLVVWMAILQIHCRKFTREVYVTVVFMAVVYIMNKLGCQAKALGRKIKISEQFVAIITLMVLYNGFVPEAFEFIYFFSGYIFFVVIHASVIQVGKSHFIVATVHHV